MKRKDFPDLLPILNEMVDILVGNDIPNKNENSKTVPEILSLMHYGKASENDVEKILKQLKLISDKTNDLIETCKIYKKFNNFV